MEEIWKHVIGLEEQYMVSNQGRVKSLDRIQPDGRKRKGRILKQSLTGSGYPRVGISVDGKGKSVLVHRLVAIHFISNPNSYEQVNHIDGDKTNYTISNLEWVTGKDNIAHAWSTGLCNGFGENHFNSKLSTAAVNFIHANALRYTQKELAELFSVSQSAISKVSRNMNRVRG